MNVKNMRDFFRGSWAVARLLIPLFFVTYLIGPDIGDISNSKQVLNFTILALMISSFLFPAIGFGRKKNWYALAGSLVGGIVAWIILFLIISLFYTPSGIVTPL